MKLIQALLEKLIPSRRQVRAAERRALALLDKNDRLTRTVAELRTALKESKSKSALRDRCISLEQRLMRQQDHNAIDRRRQTRLIARLRRAVPENLFLSESAEVNRLAEQELKTISNNKEFRHAQPINS